MDPTRPPRVLTLVLCVNTCAGHRLRPPSPSARIAKRFAQRVYLDCRCREQAFAAQGKGADARVTAPQPPQPTANS